MRTGPIADRDSEDQPQGGQQDLRHQVASIVVRRADLISGDTVAIFPFSSGGDTLDAEYCRRVGDLLVQLLSFAIRDGHLDARGGTIAALHRLMLERSLSMERLFTFAYLVERTVLDEVALSDSVGATNEPWPVVAQLIRRASFDLLSAYAERATLEQTGAAIIDRLTTLYTRPLFDAVLAKELEHAARHGYPVSLILFDLDHLSAINKEFGYGVGDKLLERLGILIKNFFRQYDWVARHSEDSIVVLLTRTDGEHATQLAERVRSTIQDRLEFTDHRTEKLVRVTISASIVNIGGTAGAAIDPERLISDAEAALERAKRQGRNRVERVDGNAAGLPT
jgi:diguanylate cyclase (GGDEF)-like protein